jgi:nicotinate-nucleotide adenylyltransferase
MSIHPYSGPSFARRRIGLLGGSFNPAHEGHLEMSLHALKRLGLDEIWWLVSPQNPLKSARDMAPFAQRMASAKSWARHPRFVVTDIESRLGTRYTADTLRALQRRFPAARFVWLMGADNLRQIPHWHRWTDIFLSIPVAVFRRPAYALNGKAADRFARARRPASFGRRLAAAKAPVWLVLDNRLNLISATALRRQMKH